MGKLEADEAWVDGSIGAGVAVDVVVDMDVDVGVVSVAVESGHKRVAPKLGSTDIKELGGITDGNLLSFSLRVGSALKERMMGSKADNGKRVLYFISVW